MFMEMLCVAGHIIHVYVYVPAWLLVGASTWSCSSLSWAVTSGTMHFSQQQSFKDSNHYNLQYLAVFPLHRAVVLPESRQKEGKQDLAFLLMQKLFSMSLFLIK